MQFCLIITHMLNDQPSLFEELIWGAYVCVCVCVGVDVCLLEKNGHLWKLHCIYSKNHVPKGRMTKKLFQSSVWSQ